MDLRKRGDPIEKTDDMSRSDFLRAVGAGLGVAGVAGLFGGQALAEAEARGKYVFVVTHGGNDPNRAILALLLAQVVAKKKWGAVHVWMTLAGAELADSEKTARIESPIFKKFGNALEIMDDLRGRGATFGVCPPCADYAGAVDGRRHAWIEKAGGDWLMENIRDAWVLWM